MERIPDVAVATRDWSSLLAHLAPSEKGRFLANLGVAPPYPAGTKLDGANGSAKARLVLSGWAMSYFVLADGERQIVDFHLPGELLETASSAHLRAFVHNVALSDLQLAHFDERVLESDSDMPRSFGARIRERQFDRHITRIASLGGHRGRVKVAALIMDWHHRLESAGLAKDGLFEAPVTQEILGDALGLSTVHVNRIIQGLRHEGIIRMNPGEIEILDLDGLAAIAGPHWPRAAETPLILQEQAR